MSFLVLLSRTHRLACLVDPTKHPEVRITLRKISRQLGTRFDQAFPITRPILDKLLGVCRTDLRGLRDRALLLLAYESMRRCSELVSVHVEDIVYATDDCMSILLCRSKTDQIGTGKWIHITAEASDVVTQWLAEVDITSSLVLRGGGPNGRVNAGLSDCLVSRIYKTLAKRA